MLLVFFENLVKILELKLGNKIYFAKLSSVNFNHSLEEHKNLNETPTRNKRMSSGTWCV